MKTKLLNLADILHASFWFIPALLLIGAWFLSIGTLTVDATLKYKALEAFGYTKGPDGARMLLSTVAGSTIGVAGVSFSIKNDMVRSILLGHAERIVQSSRKGFTLEADQQAIQRRYQEMV